MLSARTPRLIELQNRWTFSYEIDKRAVKHKNTYRKHGIIKKSSFLSCHKIQFSSMEIFSLIVLVIVMYSSNTTGHYFIIHKPIVKKSNMDSYFGYSVAQYEFDNKIWYDNCGLKFDRIFMNSFECLVIVQDFSWCSFR